MENILIMHEFTPNPNSIKFISNLTFNKNEAVSFSKKCDIELIDNLFDITEIEKIFVFDNFLTATKKKEVDWKDIVDRIKDSLKNDLPFHNPDITIKRKQPDVSNKEIVKIEKILNEKVRPYLIADGGDLKIIDLEDNTLTIEYLGACGSCPSAISGTLMGIEDVLKKEYRDDIVVKVNSQTDFDIFY